MVISIPVHPDFVPSLAGRLCRQRALWTHITKAVVRRLQRLDDTQKMNSCLQFVLLVILIIGCASNPQGQTTKVKPFPLMSLLPKHNMTQYYRYYGSLTTPPCAQAVVWTLYEVPIYISWSQVSNSPEKTAFERCPWGMQINQMFIFSPQLAQFTSQIFSTEEDAEQVTPLQNNFRHIHPTFSRIVSVSKDAKLLTGMAGHPLRSALSVHLLQIILLGSFVSRL